MARHAAWICLALAGLAASLARAKAGTVGTNSKAYAESCDAPFKELAPVPVEVGEVAAAAIDGTIYVMGTGTHNTLKYDIATNTWDRAATRPYPGGRHSAAVVNGKLYLIGGFQSASGNKVQIYNPKTDSWSEGSHSRVVAGGMSIGVLDTTLLVCGGIVDIAAGEGCYLYDTVTDGWSDATVSALYARDHAASCQDGALTYIIGGRNGPHTAGPAYSEAQVYDWDTQAWADVPALPVPRASFGCAISPAHGVYVFGSEYDDSDNATYAAGSNGTIDPATAVNSAVDRLDAVGEGWTQVASLPAGLHGVDPVTVDGMTYLFGGGLASGPGTTTTSLSVDLALLDACPPLAGTVTDSAAAAPVTPAPAPVAAPAAAAAPAALESNEIPGMPSAEGAATNSNLEGWCIVPGADYDGSAAAGYDLDTFARVGSEGECVAVCAAYSGCNAASLDVTQGKCWLKSVPYEGMRVPDLGSARVPSFGDSRVLLVQGPCNLPGGLLSEASYGCSSTGICDVSSGYCVQETEAGASSDTTVDLPIVVTGSTGPDSTQAPAADAATDTAVTAVDGAAAAQPEQTQSSESAATPATDVNAGRATSVATAVIPVAAASVLFILGML